VEFGIWIVKKLYKRASLDMFSRELTALIIFSGSAGDGMEGELQ
jgi:hypothetical protein